MVSTHAPAQPANFVLSPASNCKPDDRTLFNIQGRNITPQLPDNPAKDILRFLT